jgi:hypothetical protein
VIGQPGVQHRHRCLEAPAKTLEQLRGEPDLRHEQQRPPPGEQHPLDELQVDLGLAAAGDPVKQECAESIERGGDGLHRFALLRQQRGSGGTHHAQRHRAERHRSRRGCTWRRWHVGELHHDARDPASAEKRPRRLAPGAEMLIELRYTRLAPLDKPCEQRPLLWGAPRLAGRGGPRTRFGEKPALLTCDARGAETKRPG